MFVGHLAAALAIKAGADRAGIRVPTKDAVQVGQPLPLVPILLATGFVDDVYAILVAVGIEKIAHGRFIFIDWSHSIAMGIVWGVLFALAFYRWGWVAMSILGLTVVSHICLDILVHEADIALYPYSTIHIGLGSLVGFGGTWIIELCFILLCLLLYIRLTPQQISLNRYSLALVGVLIGIHGLRFALGL